MGTLCPDVAPQHPASRLCQSVSGGAEKEKEKKNSLLDTFFFLFHTYAARHFLQQGALSLANCYHGAFVMSGSGSLCAAASVAHYSCQSICSMSIEL